MSITGLIGKSAAKALAGLSAHRHPIIAGAIGALGGAGLVHLPARKYPKSINPPRFHKQVRDWAIAIAAQGNKETSIC